MGRDAELDALRALWARYRLVSVVGLAGVGKSRLVAEGLHDVEGTVVDVDVRDMGDVHRGTLAALGCDPGAQPGPALGALGPCTLVLEVDVVSPADVALLDAWCAEAPELTVVVTCRTAFDHDSAGRLTLEPLAAPAAVTLLIQHARRLGQDLTEAQAAALAQRLDGLPRALEWAAAVLTTLPADELLSTLERPGSSPGWRQGIERTVARLPAGLRAALLRLSVWCGPVAGRRAVEGVGELTTLQALRAHGLIGPAGPADPRLRMPEVVREVLHEGAGRDALDAARRAHADVVVGEADGAAAALMGPEGSTALTVLEQLADELRGVVERTVADGGPTVDHGARAAIALGALADLGRTRPVAEPALDQLLARAGGLEARVRCALFLERARVSRWHGDVDAAVRTLDGIAEEDRGAPADAARIALMRSACARRAGEEDLALSAAEEGVALARLADDAALHAEALAVLSRATHDLHEATALARQAVQVARRTGGALPLLGPLLALADDPGSLGEGARVAVAAGFARAEYHFRSGGACLLLEGGEVEAAEAEQRAAADLARRNGWDRLQREAGAIFAAVRWSLDPGFDPRPALRAALTDPRGASDQEMLLVFLAVADAVYRSSPGSLEVPEARGSAAARCRAAVTLLHARSGPPGGLVTALAAAEDLLADTSRDALLAVRASRRILARVAARIEGERAGAVLHVGPGGRWFSLGDGPRVSLERRAPLRRVLAALASSSSPLPVEAVFAAGWPGQSIRPASAAQRVYVAVGDLRALGLGRRLVNDGDGYGLQGPVDPASPR